MVEEEPRSALKNINAGRRGNSQFKTSHLKSEPMRDCDTVTQISHDN